MASYQAYTSHHFESAENMAKKKQIGVQTFKAEMGSTGKPANPSSKVHYQPLAPKNINCKDLKNKLLAEQQELAAAGEDDEPLPLLDAAKRYSHVSPGVCDATANNPAVRKQWTDVQMGQLPKHQDCIRETAALLPIAQTARLLTNYVAFEEAYKRLLMNAERTPGTTLLQIVEEKERLAKAHGVPDLFWALKQTETKAAATLYPVMTEELAAKTAQEGAQAGLQLAVECALAGNLFDAGAAAAVSNMAAESGADTSDEDPTVRTYKHICKKCARPASGWRFDDFEKVSKRAAERPWKRAMLFCDNAGADMLGMILLARQFLVCANAKGVETKVALVANSTPALNDITYPELLQFLVSAAENDAGLAAELASGRLVALPSGQTSSLLDLSRSGAVINAWVERETAVVPLEDWLIVLDGMGRSLESNWEAGQYFKSGVDVLGLAMIKSKINAERLKAEVYDCVVRLQPKA